MLFNIQENNANKLNNKLKKTYFKEKPPKKNNVKDFWNYFKTYFKIKGVCKDDKIILAKNDKILRKIQIFLKPSIIIFLTLQTILGNTQLG